LKEEVAYRLPDREPPVTGIREGIERMCRAAGARRPVGLESEKELKVHHSFHSQHMDVERYWNPRRN